MAPAALFGISTGFSFIAWGIASALYLWPYMRDQKRAEAMRPLLLLHSFRFVGLAFLVPSKSRLTCQRLGQLPPLTATSLPRFSPLLALAGLKSKLGMVLVWLFNVWGSADLLYAFYQGNQLDSNRVSWVPDASL
jgi:hypothetical protein